MVRRIGDAHVPADRAAVPHLDVRDRGRDLGEDRPGDLDLGGRDELRVRHHRADLEQAVGGEADRAQLLEVGEVDQHVGRRRARLHDVHERLTAGERTRSFVRSEQRDRFLHGRRPRVLDLAEKHGVDSIPRLPGLSSACLVRRGSFRT